VAVVNFLVTTKISVPIRQLKMTKSLTDHDLLYSADHRCRCGAGLAYPLDTKLSLAIRAWVCSVVLKQDMTQPEHLDIKATCQIRAHYGATQPEGEHDRYDWAFFKIREETSVNNRHCGTTRPEGTVCRSVAVAKCPCGNEWQSAPYEAGRSSHLWEQTCDRCGCTSKWKKDNLPRVEVRVKDVVLEGK
jgi:hypothetical protein